MSGTATNHDPITWFSVLHAARHSGDRDLEAMARQELRNLGYTVTVRKGADSPQEPQGAANA